MIDKSFYYPDITDSRFNIVGLCQMILGYDVYTAMVNSRQTWPTILKTVILEIFMKGPEYLKEEAQQTFRDEMKRIGY